MNRAACQGACASLPGALLVSACLYYCDTVYTNDVTNCTIDLNNCLKGIAAKCRNYCS